MDNPSLSIASNLAAEFEGLSLDPYLCPAGYPTIGYGHLLSRVNGDDVNKWVAITETEALDLLMRDMTKSLISVRRLIREPLNENQEAAICDFTFNLGGGALQASTLRRVLNREAFDEVPKQLRRWVYAGGRKLNGLIRRREAEIELFLT